MLDPFAGGGSIPLEAARLGFEAHTADLNPVAVLLNKYNLELAPRWVRQSPVNSEDRLHIGGKLNWNRCAFGSGIPITIRFARDVGKILTELPKDVQPGTKYKFYM